MSVSSEACKTAALTFAKRLATRAYDEAYAMTGREYRDEVPLERLKADFEAIVPLDWGAAEPIEIAQAMDRWTGQRDTDVLWVYVSIGGDVYSEAVTVVLAPEDGEPRIREVGFGRP